MAPLAIPKMQRGGEHGFASHTVGDESAESRTDGHANEANGEYP